jgi:hypothetical protein
MTLIPAYGRDYKSAKAVKADFDAGKDFMIADFSSPDDGRYVNKSQLRGQHFVRYQQLTKVATVEGGK